MAEKVHHGRAVKRIRELLHVKQDVLAMELNISQQSVSVLETKETIDPETLEQIAKVLKVPADAIRNFNEEAAVNIIGNTITTNNHDNASGNFSGPNLHYNSTFNPIDKWLEALEENKRLNTALLKEKDEKIALLERMLAEKKK